MSSTAPAAGSSQAASGVRPAQGAGAPGRKPGTEEETGLFANLLMLVSDTRNIDDTDRDSAPDPVPDAALAPFRPSPPSSLPASQEGWALETRLASQARGGAPQRTEGTATGAMLDSAADGAGKLPPGITLTGGRELADGEAAALALAEQAPPPGAAGRPAAAAPFLGRKGDASSATAGTAALQGLQWRKASASATADTRGIAGTGGMTGTAAAGAAAAFGALTPLAAGRAPARSTVALHDRFGASFGAAATAPESAPAGSTVGWVSALSPGSGADARGASATPSAGDPGDMGAEAAAADPADSLLAESQNSAADSAAQAAEAEARQISHWGTQTLRHASLRVGQEGEDAIDIRLSLAGQEVQVDFRTDSAEARASLQQHANESLAELLQRSGIQLGGVSVGAQGQGAAADAGTSERGRSQSRPARVAGTMPAADSPPPPATVRPRADGSRPLDVFV